MTVSKLLAKCLLFVLFFSPFRKQMEDNDVACVVWMIRIERAQLVQLEQYLIYVWNNVTEDKSKHRQPFSHVSKIHVLNALRRAIFFFIYWVLNESFFNQTKRCFLDGIATRLIYLWQEVIINTFETSQNHLSRVCNLESLKLSVISLTCCIIFHLDIAYDLPDFEFRHQLMLNGIYAHFSFQIKFRA